MNEMNEMPSGHSIRNLDSGGLRPSTPRLGHICKLVLLHVCQSIFRLYKLFSITGFTYSVIFLSNTMQYFFNVFQHILITLETDIDWYVILMS